MGKIPTYTALTAPNNNDLLVIEDSVSSSTKKITRENFLKGTALPADTVTTAAITDSSVTSPKLATGVPVQIVEANYSAVATGSTQIPIDDTIPQITEGNEYMTISFTPKSATNKLSIEANVFLSNDTATRWLSAALFQDAITNALAADTHLMATATGATVVPIRHSMTAGTTSPITFTVRAGANNTGTTTFNGVSGARRFGGVTVSSIKVTEYKA